jgi:hypothetical protein
MITIQLEPLPAVLICLALVFLAISALIIAMTKVPFKPSKDLGNEFEKTGQY